MNNTTKIGIWLLVAFIIAIVIYFIFRKKKNPGEVTPSDIEKSTSLDKGEAASLSHDDLYYQTIAQSQFDSMNAWGTEGDGKGGKLFADLYPLNAAELKKVAGYFGLRASTIWTPFGEKEIGEPQSIFDWYNEELSGTDLAEMQKIWAKTGLF